MTERKDVTPEMAKAGGSVIYSRPSLCEDGWDELAVEVYETMESVRRQNSARAKRERTSVDEIELRLRCLELAIASCKFGLPEDPSLLFGAATAYQDYVLGRVTGGLPSEPVGSDPETAAPLQ